MHDVKCISDADDDCDEAADEQDGDDGNPASSHGVVPSARRSVKWGGLTTCPQGEEVFNPCFVGKTHVQRVFVLDFETRCEHVPETSQCLLYH